MAAPGAPVESEESDDEYVVKKIGQNEDLVIDGETAVDDLLVAQRIAEQEAFIADEVAASDDEAKVAREKRQKATPNNNDVEKLLRLVRHTAKLSKKNV
jgi:phosphosulfolactate phosphohydrolase-like enzyme